MCGWCTHACMCPMPCHVLPRALLEIRAANGWACLPAFGRPNSDLWPLPDHHICACMCCSFLPPFPRSGAHSLHVVGCEQCTTGQGGCPDPLPVLSQLCLSGSGSDGSPSLSQCTSFATLCGEAGATFSALCSGDGALGGGSGSTIVPMKMYLHASMSGEQKAGSTQRWQRRRWRKGRAGQQCPGTHRHEPWGTHKLGELGLRSSCSATEPTPCPPLPCPPCCSPHCVQVLGAHVCWRLHRILPGHHCYGGGGTGSQGSTPTHGGPLGNPAGSSRRGGSSRPRLHLWPLPQQRQRRRRRPQQHRCQGPPAQQHHQQRPHASLKHGGPVGARRRRQRRPAALHDPTRGKCMH